MTNDISTQPFKFPLVIGVTGHRDIPKESLPALEEKSSEGFDNLKEKYPATPFILLTPLAEILGVSRDSDVAISHKMHL